MKKIVPPVKMYFASRKTLILDHAPGLNCGAAVGKIFFLV